MVKLIASDMDGTLLNSRKEIPEGFRPLLEKLRARGIQFAAASGRQYFSLLDCFPGLEKEIAFICEGGALVFDRGECIFADAIEADILAEVTAAVREIPGANVVLCGVKSAYVAQGDEEFYRNVSQYYVRCERAGDLLEAAGQDQICKIAVFRSGSAEEVLYPSLLRFSNRLMVSLSGSCWVDMMNAGVNKGTALIQLQKRYGIGPDECMAFGDYLNDCELLQACTHSYAMANAHPALKILARHEARSNDEEGVLQALREYFQI